MNPLLERAAAEHRRLLAERDRLLRERKALQDEIDPMGPQNRCLDFDDDCADVCDKVYCWLHDPTRGWCPYLRQP